MKKIIRNIGYVHPLKSEDEREFVTQVDYAARTYQFPKGKDTVVEADVADYVSSLYAGKGLVIPDRPLEMKEQLDTRLAAARALIPPPPPGPAIPALRRSSQERPKPIAGTEAIRLAREAAAKGVSRLAPAAPPSPAPTASQLAGVVESPATVQAADLKAKIAAARAKAPAPAAQPAAPPRPATKKDTVADTKARIAASKAKK